jgi:O-antigen ligase
LFFLSPFILLVIGLFSSVSADRILSTLTEGDSGDRDQYFNAAIYQFLNSPFWGGSFVLNNGIGKGDYPHNLFLESLLAFGIFGGLVIIYFYYRGFKSSFNLLYFNYNNKWLALLFIQFFIFSSISGALWSSIHFIIILSILLNGSYIKTANSTAD